MTPDTLNQIITISHLLYNNERVVNDTQVDLKDMNEYATNPLNVEEVLGPPCARCRFGWRGALNRHTHSAIGTLAELLVLYGLTRLPPSSPMYAEQVSWVTDAHGQYKDNYDLLLYRSDWVKPVTVQVKSSRLGGRKVKLYYDWFYYRDETGKEHERNFAQRLIIADLYSKQALSTDYGIACRAFDTARWAAKTGSGAICYEVPTDKLLAAKFAGVFSLNI